jgi:two-component system, NarL family, invasion response regulator UvrY
MLPLPKKQTRVAIFDRLPVTQFGLRYKFETEGFEVVDSGSDAKRAIQLFRDDTDIDVAVLDIDLEYETAFHVIETVKQKQLKTKYVIFTELSDSVYVEKAVNCCNVAGFILKTDPLEVLVNAVHGAADGRRVFSAEIEHLIVRDSTGRLSSPVVDPLSKLSPRQLEVFRLLGLGFSVSEAARRLSCSTKAAGSAAHQIHKRLNISSRAELVALGIDAGIVAPGRYRPGA